MASCWACSNGPFLACLDESLLATRMTPCCRDRQPLCIQRSAQEPRFLLEIESLPIRVCLCSTRVPYDCEGLSTVVEQSAMGIMKHNIGPIWYRMRTA